MSDDVRIVPTRIAQKGPRELQIVWSDDVESVYDVRLLRLACACARCVDEWTGEERLDPADNLEALRGECDLVVVCSDA